MTASAALSASAGFVLSIDHLVYAWPGHADPVLKINDLRIPLHSRTFLYGPSGCGKSTLLSLMAGVLLPTSGSVELLGQRWQRLKAARRDRYRADHVGYIFQQFNLVPYISALENVLAPCYFSAQRRQAAMADHGSPAASAEALLLAMGLTPEDINRPAGNLSVGQQQRVAAARALIGRPALVIADEPTSALDDDTTHSFMQHLSSAVDKAQSSLVFVSHDRNLQTYFNQHVFLPEINLAGPLHKTTGHAVAAGVAT